MSKNRNTTPETPFSFLGYISSKIDLNKTRSSFLNKVKINCFNVNFSTDTNICSIGIRVLLDFDDSHDNVLEYISDYIIRDEAIKTDLILNDQGISEEKRKEIDPLISTMISSVFPYIRQHISAITSDSTKQITLPTLDVRRISLSTGIELTTHVKAENRKKISK